MAIPPIYHSANIVVGTLFLGKQEKELFDAMHFSMSENVNREFQLLNAVQQELKTIAQTPVKTTEEVEFLRNWKEYEDFIFRYWSRINNIIKDIDDLIKHTDANGKVVIKHADERIIYRIDNLVRKVNFDVKDLIEIIKRLIEILKIQLHMYKDIRSFESADLLIEHANDIEKVLKNKLKNLRQIRKNYSVAWHEIQKLR